MEPILLFGASGHARVVIDIVEKAGQFRICGIIDRDLPAGSEFCRYPVLGDETSLPEIVESTGVRSGIVGIGDNWIRFQVADRVAAAVEGFRFVTAIHPAAVIGSDVEVGAGTVVMAGAVLNPGTWVGDGCIVNTGAMIDHDNFLGNYASLAPGVITGGGVRVGEFAAVGLGAHVIHGIKIGHHAVVGAGALVLDHVGDQELVFGSPAKFVRKRNPGEKYL